MRGKNGKSQLNGFLDAGSHLRGDLHFDDTFRIDGKLTGKVDSDGDLYVGQSGEVEGEIRVGRLVVSGRVQAVVQAQRVEVAAGGQLRGEIVTPTLVIDEGAIFEGLSRMVERGAPLALSGAVRQERGRNGAAIAVLVSGYGNLAYVTYTASGGAYELVRPTWQIVGVAALGVVLVGTSGFVGWIFGATLAQRYLVRIGHPTAEERREARRGHWWR